MGMTLFAEYRRTPQGVRGLKLKSKTASVTLAQSHPARGAWIEMPFADFGKAAAGGRTPQGVRGLKSKRRRLQEAKLQSHPARGAWIEIIRAHN